MEKAADVILTILRTIYNLPYRVRIREVPTIISRDCIGGILYKRIHAGFTSPTINLYMTNEDFILFCSHLKEYLNEPVEEEKNDLAYPSGIIHGAHGDIRLYFMHYHSFVEARDCWERRKKRVRYDNIRLILNAGPDVGESILEKFGHLPYPKILLSSGLEERENIVNLKCYQFKDKKLPTDYRSQKCPVARYMDEVDWIKFLRNGTVRKSQFWKTCKEKTLDTFFPI